MKMTPAQQKLALDNLDLADKVAQKLIKNNFLGFDEVRSISLEALCKAARDWRSDGIKFENYAVMKMYNSVIDFIRKETDWDRDKEVSRTTFQALPWTTLQASPSQKDKFHSRAFIDQTTFQEYYPCEITDSLQNHLASLSDKKRKMVLDFAEHGIGAAAKMNGVTEARISQARSEARKKWNDKLGIKPAKMTLKFGVQD